MYYSSWYFLEINFGFQQKTCDGCHDSIQKAMGFIDVVILSVKRKHYSVIFWYINKDKVINII